MKFCDYHKEKPYKDDKQAWMLICTDSVGKVMILKVYTYFKMLTVEKVLWMESSFN